MSDSREAFDKWAWKYADDEEAWEDMGLDEHFIAGYEAGQASRQGIEFCHNSGVWQFYQNGEWSVGSNTHNHRENTEEGGFPTRDLYTRSASAKQEQGDE